ncbi:hypothetical protein NPIL_91841 [Nephila pilipes]|uniref:Uncharacterized protein n=1 Tax=Nephila pilipes TaxID=299642 RepID=A0A8X6TRP1_NEPPI|nr:hypothetical protein NPIL_91841 [Nephila pilipes]
MTWIVHIPIFPRSFPLSPPPLQSDIPSHISVINTRTSSRIKPLTKTPFAFRELVGQYSLPGPDGSVAVEEGCLKLASQEVCQLRHAKYN